MKTFLSFRVRQLLVTTIFCLLGGAAAFSQSNGDGLQWDGGTSQSEWASANPVWYDFNSSTPVSISSSTGNTYGFYFNLQPANGTAAPNAMTDSAVLNASTVDFTPGFASGNSTTITGLTNGLANALNFTSGASLADVAPNGTVTFSAPSNGGFGGLYFELSGALDVIVSNGSNIVTNLDIVDNPAGSGGSIALDGGTLTLGGNENEYTGGTTVTSGTLLVTSSGAGTGTGSLTVENTGSVLGGTGHVSSSTTIDSGAILQPGLGGSSISKLAFASGITLDGNYHVNLLGGGTVAGVNNSQVDLSGSLVINPASSNLLISTTNASALAVGQKFFITLDSGSTPVTGTFANALTPGSTVSDNLGDTFTVNYTDNGDSGTIGNDISLTVATVVPEPSTWTLLASGIIPIALFGRRSSAWLKRPNEIQD